MHASIAFFPVFSKVFIDFTCWQTELCKSLYFSNGF